MLATAHETAMLSTALTEADIPLPVLSKRSGVSVTMLKRIAKGKEKSLRYETLRRINMVLEDYEEV